MRFEDQAEGLAFVLELDLQESHSFLIGLSNGMSISALLALLVWALVQIWGGH